MFNKYKAKLQINSLQDEQDEIETVLSLKKNAHWLANTRNKQAKLQVPRAPVSLQHLPN